MNVYFDPKLRRAALLIPFDKKLLLLGGTLHLRTHYFHANPDALLFFSIRKDANKTQHCTLKSSRFLYPIWWFVSQYSSTNSKTL